MALDWKPGLETADGRWVVAQLDQSWRLACRIAIQGDSLVIAELRFGAESGVPPGGIGSRQVEAIRIRGAVAAARAAGLRPEVLREAADPTAVQAFIHSRKRRDRLPKLAAIALMYDQAVRDGRQDRAVAIVEATGLKYKTVIDYTHAARNHEPSLLTGGGRGKTVGKATDEARRIAAGWWVAFAGPAQMVTTAYGATVRTVDGASRRTTPRTT